jgi:hypothetical protein
MERRDSSAHGSTRGLEKFEHGTHRKEAVKRLQKTPTKDITAIVIIVVAMD